jgi:hypothetical protein
MSELILKPVNVLTPTVKVETKTKPRSAVVKNFAIGFLPSIEGKLGRDRSASCDGNHRPGPCPNTQRPIAYQTLPNSHDLGSVISLII